MTEEEWLTSDDPETMAAVAVTSPRASNRTRRLFVAGFWGWQAEQVPEERRHELRSRVDLVERWAETKRLPKPTRSSASPTDLFFNRYSSRSVAWTARCPRAWGSDGRAAMALLPGLLRCIFGNPFRPVALDAAWRTSAVVALATGIYADRAFDRLPVLADALEDAGCDQPDIIGHLRGPGPHARGCWVVDLLLGKG